VRFIKKESDYIKTIDEIKNNEMDAGHTYFEDFEFVFKEYALERDENLTEDAKELKQAIIYTVFDMFSRLTDISLDTLKLIIKHYNIELG
jgi:DNA polymerase III sliding clamp (beta) subunit (PCNA family)